MTSEERFRQLPTKKWKNMTKEERFQSWLDQPAPPPEPEGMTTWKWIKWAAYVIAPLGLLTALTHDFGIVLMCLGPVMGLVLVFGVLGDSSSSPQPEARKLSPDGGVKVTD
jgi:hypothetical protein